MAVSKPVQGRRPAKPALLAAGGTSAAAADKSERSGGKGKLTPPAAGGTSVVAVSKPEQVGRQAGQARPVGGWRDQRGGGGHSRAAKQASRLQLQGAETRQSDPQKLPREFSGSTRDTGWLHRQGSGDDSGKILLRYPDGGRDSVVRQGGQELQQDALQAPEEKREEVV